MIFLLKMDFTVFLSLSYTVFPQNSVILSLKAFLSYSATIPQKAKETLKNQGFFRKQRGQEDSNPRPFGP